MSWPHSKEMDERLAEITEREEWLAENIGEDHYNWDAIRRDFVCKDSEDEVLYRLRFER